MPAKPKNRQRTGPDFPLIDVVLFEVTWLDVLDVLIENYESKYVPPLEEVAFYSYTHQA